MNDAAIKAKQQIVEKIKGSTNILVTVSQNPSVDDLSAALGLTALLNKLDKHATAIFSGAVPPAITFLDPEKVFESNADSLRDFIIALDKEKADHLRYKIEGDVVKIFITPYRTTITKDDLEFSQGDFNVELVLALGVSSQENLDAALAAHGPMFHDVTIATLSAGSQLSNLGSIDWHDESASSLSEMIAELSDAVRTDKVLLDKQISTALMTGIVAATDRFSNARTSARVMTAAAQLMAAGADQQLIAARLQETHEINTSTPIPKEDGEAGEVLNVKASAEPVVESQSTLPPPGELIVSHESNKDSDIAQNNNATTVAPEVSAPIIAAEPVTLPQPPEPAPENLVSSTLPPVSEPANTPQIFTSEAPSPSGEPSLGGELNATTEQAAEENRRELEDQQNKTILAHTYLSGSSPGNTVSPINGVGQDEDLTDVDIFNEMPPSSTLPPSESKFELPLPPPLPTFAPATLPPSPLPDYNIPAGEFSSSFESSTLPSQQAVSSDPTQFKIPGQ
jgi:hypothetical protein